MSSPLGFIARVLTGRFSAEDVENTGRAHLAVGLAFTWLAGIGRYWDSPRASTLQHLGLGSVAYVLVLSAFLWLLLMPMRPDRWSYVKILTFVCAVAPPALLYAIPVERFMSLNAARSVNVWFLAIVATWRVILYFVFLVQYAGFRGLRLLVGALLPLAIIVFSLTALNLERAVFDLMAGISPTEGTSADTAYSVLFTLSLFSYLASPVMVLLYFVAIYNARRAKPSPMEDEASAGR